MIFREFKIPGAWEISHDLHHDDRGLFYEWFTQREFSELTGHPFELTTPLKTKSINRRCPEHRAPGRAVSARPV